MLLTTELSYSPSRWPFSQASCNLDSASATFKMSSVVFWRTCHMRTKQISVSLLAPQGVQRLYLFASRLGGWALRTSRQWFLNRGKPICSIWSFLFVIKTRVWYIQKVLRPSDPTDWGSPDSNQNCEASAFWYLMSYEKLEQIMSTTHDGERTLSNGLETKTLSSSAPHWSQACMEQSICNWAAVKVRCGEIGHDPGGTDCPG